jgi:hypothetical protein
MENKHLNFGVYDTTATFRQIDQHACVCFDDMGLVAVTGEAGDKESQEYAQLFAASKDMLKCLKAIRRYLETGGITTKSDRAFVLDKIEAVIDAAENPKYYDEMTKESE